MDIDFVCILYSLFSNFYCFCSLYKCCFKHKPYLMASFISEAVTLPLSTWSFFSTLGFTAIIIGIPAPSHWVIPNDVKNGSYCYNVRCSTLIVEGMPWPKNRCNSLPDTDRTYHITVFKELVVCGCHLI